MTDEEEERDDAARSTAEILARSDGLADTFDRLLKESEQLLDQLRKQG